MQADPDLTRTVLVTTKLDTKLPQFSEGDDLEDFLRYVRTYCTSHFILPFSLLSSSSLLSSLLYFSSSSSLSFPLLCSPILCHQNLATPPFIHKLEFFLFTLCIYFSIPSLLLFLPPYYLSFLFPSSLSFLTSYVSYLIPSYLFLLLSISYQSPFDKEVVPSYDGGTVLHFRSFR